MVGFFNQFSYGTLIYNGSLSFYFLLTARFGYSNAYMARVIEPWIHIAGNGFAGITSIVALALGAYDEMTGGTGCWVANYPRGCGEGPGCTSRLIGWLYFGLLSISIFILVLIFNSMILIFVRRNRVPFKMSTPDVETKKKLYLDESSSNHEDDDERRRKVERTTEMNGIDNERQSQNASQSKDQARRLRLVSTQAFLYVAFFLICNVWTGTVGIIESSGDTREEELQLVVDNYVVFLLQAFLTPLQGFFNMAVFIRPKLYLCIAAFPGESRLWIVRRTILGNRVKPTGSSDHTPRIIDGQRVAPVDPMDDKRQEESATSEPVTIRQPRDIASSVRISNNSDERWSTNKETGFSSILTSLPIRFESVRNPRSSLLEAISEHEVSTFEHSGCIPKVDKQLLDLSSGDYFPATAESRWASDSIDPMSRNSDSGPVPMPQRELIRTVEEPDQSSSLRHLHGVSPKKAPVADQPIKAPQRRSIPGSPSSERKDIESKLQSSWRQVTETDNDQDEVQLYADKPIKAPVRRDSPPSWDGYNFD